MKKKIIGITIAGLLVLSGIVSAASMWGTYKGNDIIRLTVGGSPARVSDVPAIGYNGRTMIPIYLLQQAGISYTWDQANRTVDISPPPQVDVNAVRESPISWLKMFTEGMDAYERLMNLGEELDYLHLMIYSFMSDSLTNTTFMNETSVKNRYDTANNLYIAVKKVAESTGSWLTENEYSHDFDSILSQYNRALDYYHDAIDQIDVHQSLKDNTSFNNYLNDLKAAEELVNLSQSKSFTGYHKYHDLIVNYK